MGMTSSSPRPERLSVLARQIIFAGAMVVSVLLPPVILGTFLVPFVADDQNDGEFLLFTGLIVATLALAGAPFAGGLIALAWTVDPYTRQGRRAFVILGLSIEATVVIAFFALFSLAVASDAIPPNVAAAIAIGSAVCSAGCIWLGTSARIHAASRPSRPWNPNFIQPANIRRIQRRTVWTFVVTLLASLTVLGVPSFAIRDQVDFLAELLFTSLTISFFAAAATGALISLPLTHRLQEIFGDDIGLRQRVVRTVLSGKPSLGAADESIASHYAALMTSWYPLQLSQSLFLFAGALTVTSSSLLDGNSTLRWVPVASAAIVILSAAVAVPIALRRIRRVRQFRDEHIHNVPESL